MYIDQSVDTKKLLKQEVHMTYNALRQLIEVKDWLGTTQIDVGALGRPLSLNLTHKYKIND